MCYVWTYIQRIIFSIKKNLASSEKKLRPFDKFFFLHCKANQYIEKGEN